MEKKVNKQAKEVEKLIAFEQVIERGCGIDVHQDSVVATIQGKPPCWLSQQKSR